MTASTSISSRSRRWACPRSYALIAVFCLFIVGLASFHNHAQAQKRRARKPAPRPSAATARIDYSRFSHATKKHQGACNSCHQVPTDNWKKVGDYPDVADYPGHNACVSCHRPQFFRGAKPPICSVCHTKVSPRDEARFVFRNPVAGRQFLIEFPHDKHQDVIAKLSADPPAVTQAAGLRPVTHSALAQTVSLRAWAHARSFAATQTQTNPASPRGQPAGSGLSFRYYNCEVCHGTPTKAPIAPAVGWLDGYVPDAATFKTAPTSHAACFNCHWKSQPPIRDDCAGCHKLSEKPLAPVVAGALPTRISLKFQHASKQHAVQECATCHINITKAATLRGLTPDVPISSCATSSCHHNGINHEEVADELAAIEKDKQFVCRYCHTSNVGKLDPPASHSLAVEAKLLLRKDLK